MLSSSSVDRLERAVQGYRRPPARPASSPNRSDYKEFESCLVNRILIYNRLNELMDSKGAKKKSSSSKSIFYEAPLGYSIEDVRPAGGIKKFRSAAYSNCVRKPS
ncbi:hypothetical protein MLD38_022575 [Melastoma candidum]|uniref:Uncharacterized protein n=1 Tax=Melastoma candidum TaxID=119954 RepID=A0ACB9QJV9_9MYRT|nr:hypothetical protein MLD38_022575 [Melastoma candidum]